MEYTCRLSYIVPAAAHSDLTSKYRTDSLFCTTDGNWKLMFLTLEFLTLSLQQDLDLL